MATITSTDLISQLNWRYATKSFDSTKTIPAETIATLEESLVLTPSSFGLQPWKFIVVSDQALKDQMPAVSWDQQQPKDCSHMVVLAVKANFTREDVARYVARMAEVQGKTVEELAGYEGFAGGFVDKAVGEGWITSWAKNQVYIAIGQLMASAALLGIDACPMEGINPEAYDKILGLEDGDYRTVLACPLGYRNASDKYASSPKVRYESSAVIDRR